MSENLPPARPEGTRKAVRTVKEYGPDPVDVHVGARMRLRRSLLRMSQEELAMAIGVTFQQVQKYERGTNRISASRLYDISRALGVGISFFFDDIGDKTLEERASALPPEIADAAMAILSRHQDATCRQDDGMNRTTTLRMARAFLRLPDDDTRDKMVDLLESLVKQPK